MTISTVKALGIIGDNERLSIRGNRYPDEITITIFINIIIQYTTGYLKLK